MLYTIHRGNTDYKGGQEPVVHLVSSAETVAQARPPLQWMFTEGHAEIAFSQFFNDLEDLDEVDWEVMKSNYWHDTEADNDRKRRRQAEFLVHRFFPWALAQEIGVCNEAVATQVQEHLTQAAHRPVVNVRRQWYY